MTPLRTCPFGVLFVLRFGVALLAARTAEAVSFDDRFPAHVEAFNQRGEVRLSPRPEVLAELKQRLPGGRWRRTHVVGRDRLKRFESDVRRSLADARLPVELMAIPLVESGYRNIPSLDRGRSGSGLWMMTKATARRLGLTVRKGRDDRLNPKKQTAAAMKLLRLHIDKYRDWELALLAYNAGEGSVDRAIRSAGTRNAWSLVKVNRRADPKYLAKVSATMLLLFAPGIEGGELPAVIEGPAPARVDASPAAPAHAPVPGSPDRSAWSPRGKVEGTP